MQITIVPMPGQRENNPGETPNCVLADAEYFAEKAVESAVEGFTEPFIPCERKKHIDSPEPAPRGRIPDNGYF